MHQVPDFRRPREHRPAHPLRLGVARRHAPRHSRHRPDAVPRLPAQGRIHAATQDRCLSPTGGHVEQAGDGAHPLAIRGRLFRFDPAVDEEPRPVVAAVARFEPLVSRIQRSPSATSCAFCPRSWCPAPLASRQTDVLQRCGWNFVGPTHVERIEPDVLKGRYRAGGTFDRPRRQTCP